MIYTYMILDDDIAFTALLKKQLESIDQISFIGAFVDTIQGVKAITKFKPNLLFLDLEIDGLNGLDVLDVLEYKPLTIVISAAENFKLDMDRPDICDYIRKPLISRDRLEPAVRKAIESYNSKKNPRV